ncbi:MAG: ATP-binding protein [Pseudomonadota bacterium]
MPSQIPYPFPAIVGQEAMKQALILNVINPSLSGVLIRGEKGTAKSTAVRALAEILPDVAVIRDCPFQRRPGEPEHVCQNCPSTECRSKVLNGLEPETLIRGIRVIELPLGATEDRVVGSLDLEHALKQGEKKIEPGILAAAHGGILYVDEVNLLDDHVVDVLLDSAAMGINTIEREGVGFSHPSRFTLVGTMNPEEGELRPQLLDRFGLCVTITGIEDIDARVDVMERRALFEADPEAFLRQWENASAKLRTKIENAIDLLPEVTVERSLLMEIARYCLKVGVDGHRGDIVILKTARTLAAYHGRTRILEEDIDAAAKLALPHRIRRQPLQDMIADPGNLPERS